MFGKNGVALEWVALFGLKEENKKEIVRSIKDGRVVSYAPESLANSLGFYEKPYSKAVLTACEVVSLRFCLQDTDFAKDFLSEENFDKALNLFERKQYSSKLLKEVLAIFYTVINGRYNGRLIEEKLEPLLKLDIVRTAKVINEELAEKSFSELKKVMEKIASGVKSDCYFAAEGARRRDAIKKELNDFIVEKYGYDLNKYYLYRNSDKSLMSIFRLALFDDKEFWKAHGNFDVYAFIDSIYTYNDEKHAQKVLTYIFDKIKDNEIGKYLIEHNLSLISLYESELFSLERKNVLRFFYRFEKFYDLGIIKDESYCYPYKKSENDEKKIASGKEIFNGLINWIYPADGERVIKFFNGQLNGDEPFITDRYPVEYRLKWFSSCLWHKEEAGEAVLAYCSDYFSAENVWSRIYLIAYAAFKLESNINKCYANLFEIFYGLFKIVENKFGLKTSYQNDNTGRDSTYAELKSILKKYGAEISDKFKNDYIISLLDRKVATIEESERFPVLEQLGDAVYGFAVAEMMFYQPTDYEPESIFRDYENYICAKAQIEIVKKLGIDKLYLSPLSLSCKSVDMAQAKEIFLLGGGLVSDEETDFKFLADSLEMIIGTICKDLGYQAAIDFTKRIVKETYPEVFKKEIRWENRDEADPEQDIDSEYWNRIMPAPFYESREYSSREYYDDMGRAFTKFMLAYCLGTDNVETRKFLTQRYYYSEYGDELFGNHALGRWNINYATFDYLHKGLAYSVDKYATVIKENYKKINK